MAAASFMKCCLVRHTITGAAEDMTGTVVESDSDNIEHKLQSLSKTVVKSLSDMRSEIAHVLANIGVMTKADVEEIVESLTKSANTLLSQIVNSVKSTFEGALKYELFYI